VLIHRWPTFDCLGYTSQMNRQKYLNAMGVKVYRLRDQLQVVDDVMQAGSVLEEQLPVSSGAPPASVKPALSHSADLPDYDLPDHDDEGYDDDVAAYLGGADTTTQVTADDVSGLSWQQLQERIAGCSQCGLCQSRKNTVFGVGNPRANVMVVGEAPGADEDAAGEPFVGLAGQLLDNMLKAIGLDRKQVFIANILKCRPPSNRNPEPAEIRACKPYLDRQIALIQPKLILSVGGVSAQNLLQSEETVGRLRQQPRHLPESNIPVHVTYHPAYLLRKPSEKAKSWQDLKRFMRAMQS
jgi:uracil-DNA glycosylase family 4